MFQTLSNKVISGVVYLSMVLFSSYEGNIAYFDKINHEFFNNKLVMRTELLSAFENDFEDMFKSGQPINIYFDVAVKDNESEIHNNRFMHTVKYDPMSRVYYVMLEEKSKNYRIIDDYKNMLQLISHIEYHCDVNNSEEFNVTLEATLETIRLQSLNKDFDLMTLWKFKKPKLKTKIIKEIYES